MLHVKVNFPQNLSRVNRGHISVNRKLDTWLGNPGILLLLKPNDEYACFSMWACMDAEDND